MNYVTFVCDNEDKYFSLCFGEYYQPNIIRMSYFVFGDNDKNHFTNSISACFLTNSY